eukprot:3698859-Amphidinium_carterae.1
MIDILTTAAPRRVELNGRAVGVTERAAPLLSNFFTTVPSDILSSWRNVAKHPIAYVELFAYVLARAVWSKLLTGSRLLANIDNEVALHALIAARAKSDSIVAMLREVALADLHTPTLTWFYRCPSNPADSL